MKFSDRKDAGQQLAKKLEKYRGKPDVVVLAIARGGVEVGHEVARAIEADFSVVVTRKLPFPDNPESGFGAIAEDGSVYLSDRSRFMEEPLIKDIMEKQKAEIRRRIGSLRNGEPLPAIAGKTVIVVDDGIAVGSTMRATVMLCENRQAGRVIVAAPVSSGLALREFGSLADEVHILTTPPDFYAVAQVYENWYDVSDREVVDLLAAHSGE